jgi:hypothetical protein
MPYKGTSIRIGEMLDELVQNGRAEYSAATELGRALEEGAIILVFNDAPLSPDFLPGIAEYLQVAATGNAREIRLRFGWASDIILHAYAFREQFETACGLSAIEEESPSIAYRRFTSDEELVAEALEGIRAGRWSNAHQAAIALEPRAEGASSDAKIRRLGGKIRGAMS